MSDGVCLKRWVVLKRWQKGLGDVAGTKRDDQIFGFWCSRFDLPHPI